MKLVICMCILDAWFLGEVTAWRQMKSADFGVPKVAHLLWCAVRSQFWFISYCAKMYVHFECGVVKRKKL